MILQKYTQFFQAVKPLKPAGRLLITATTVLILSLIVNVATPYIVTAAPSDEWTPSERAQQWAYLNAVEKCIKDGHLKDYYSSNWDVFGEDHITEKHAESGDWWYDDTNPTWEKAKRNDTPQVAASSYLFPGAGDDGNATCNEILKAAVPMWGFNDPMDLLCSFVATRKNGRSCDGSGNGDFGEIKTYHNAFRDSILQKLWGGLSSPELGAGWYPLYFQAFEKGCKAVPNDNPPSDDLKYIVTVVDPTTGKSNDVTYEANSRSTKVLVYTGGDLSQVKMSCQEIAENINSAAGIYIDWFSLNGREDIPNEKAGYTPPGGEGKSTCKVDGIGWLVCPVLTFLGGVADQSYGVVERFLRFDVALINDADLQAAWSYFRNIANILFVIAFLVIVYSQITGYGLNNYGIKTLLPKLIIAAVLVNISFWVCAAAVDISNILGSSFKSLFENISVASGGGNSGGAGRIGDGITWVTVITGILAAGIVVALAASLPVLTAALLAVGMILLILMLRQAAIVILIVTSPVAFVAYLLPNTQQWFKRWTQMFSSLLMLYPIVAIVFGASAFAANLIANVGGGGSVGSDISGGGADNELLQIAALGIATTPFFVVPGLLKNSLNALGSIGGKLSAMSTKANSNVRGKAMTESRLGEAVAAHKQRGALRRAKRRNNRFNRAIDNSWVGRKIGGDIGAARARAEARSQENKDIKEMAESMTEESISKVDYQSKNGYAGKGRTTYLQDQFHEAINSGNTRKAQAAIYALKGQGEPGVDAIQQTLQKNMTDGKSLKDGDRTTRMGYELQEAINTEHQDLKDKDARITSWAGSGTSESIQFSNLSGLTNRQIASQTISALEAAQQEVNPDGSTTAKNPDGTVAMNPDGSAKRAIPQLTPDVQARVAKAADQGTIDLKQNKQRFFQASAGGGAATTTSTAAPAGTGGTGPAPAGGGAAPVGAAPTVAQPVTGGAPLPAAGQTPAGWGPNQMGIITPGGVNGNQAAAAGGATPTGAPPTTPTTPSPTPSGGGGGGGGGTPPPTTTPSPGPGPIPPTPTTPPPAPGGGTATPTGGAAGFKTSPARPAQRPLSPTPVTPPPTPTSDSTSSASSTDEILASAGSATAGVFTPPVEDLVKLARGESIPGPDGSWIDGRDESNQVWAFQGIASRGTDDMVGQAYDIARTSNSKFLRSEFDNAIGMSGNTPSWYTKDVSRSLSTSGGTGGLAKSYKDLTRRP